MQLSNAEEQLMQFLWKQKRAFMKDLIEAYPDPKPAQTTVATLLKRMQDKGFVDYKQMGRSREYFPLVKKSDYFGKQVKGMIQNFFNNDAAQFASFFTESTDLSKEELQKLRNLIDQQIKSK
ncbi:MAG: penicillinase repressor [Flavobacteriaceae bacterium]|nr:penicillinase repressor [Flavobacteriaceae bacterium]|tara:strand:- start:21861 stop:22226 length:366 start_codon:yes stop_codon:yes gene_type:complete